MSCGKGVLWSLIETALGKGGPKLLARVPSPYGKALTLAFNYGLRYLPKDKVKCKELSSYRLELGVSRSGRLIGGARALTYHPIKAESVVPGNERSTRSSSSRPRPSDASMKVAVSIDGGTPASRELYGRVQRAIASDRTAQPHPVRRPSRDPPGLDRADRRHRRRGVHLIPPLYPHHGLNIRVGRNVFINQACMLNDIGGIEIGDDVVVEPAGEPAHGGHPLIRVGDAGRSWRRRS